MTLDRKSTNSETKIRTNLPDWSALIPVLPPAGRRTPALYRELRRLQHVARLDEQSGQMEQDQTRVQRDAVLALWQSVFDSAPAA